MAKKKTTPINTGGTFAERKCRECANHYDEHSPAIDGHMILCRCPYKQEGGKYCIFLNDTACNLFKPIT